MDANRLDSSERVGVLGGDGVVPSEVAVVVS